MCNKHLCLVFILSILGYFLSDEIKLFILFYVFNVTCTFIYINHHVRHTFIHICLHFLYSRICVELYYCMFQCQVQYCILFFNLNVKHIFIFIYLFFFILTLYVKNSFFNYTFTFYKLICSGYFKQFICTTDCCKKKHSHIRFKKSKIIKKKKT